MYHLSTIPGPCVCSESPSSSLEQPSSQSPNLQHANHQHDSSQPASQPALQSARLGFVTLPVLSRFTCYLPFLSRIIRYLPVLILP
eukprot:superscaffoldBa00000659_g6378